MSNVFLQQLGGFVPLTLRQRSTTPAPNTQLQELLNQLAQIEPAGDPANVGTGVLPFLQPPRTENSQPEPAPEPQPEGQSIFDRIAERIVNPPPAKIPSLPDVGTIDQIAVERQGDAQPAPAASLPNPPVDIASLDRADAEEILGNLALIEQQFGQSSAQNPFSVGGLSSSLPQLQASQDARGGDPLLAAAIAGREQPSQQANAATQGLAGLPQLPLLGGFQGDVAQEAFIDAFTNSRNAGRIEQLEDQQNELESIANDERTRINRLEQDNRLGSTPAEQSNAGSRVFDELDAQAGSGADPEFVGGSPIKGTYTEQHATLDIVAEYLRGESTLAEVAQNFEASELFTSSEINRILEQARRILGLNERDQPSQAPFDPSTLTIEQLYNIITYDSDPAVRARLQAGLEPILRSGDSPERRRQRLITLLDKIDNLKFTTGGGDLYVIEPEDVQALIDSGEI